MFLREIAAVGGRSALRVDQRLEGPHDVLLRRDALARTLHDGVEGFASVVTSGDRRSLRLDPEQIELRGKRIHRCLQRTQPLIEIAARFRHLLEADRASHKDRVASSQATSIASR